MESEPENPAVAVGSWIGAYPSQPRRRPPAARHLAPNAGPVCGMQVSLKVVMSPIWNLTWKVMLNILELGDQKSTMRYPFHMIQNGSTAIQRLHLSACQQISE